MVTYSPIITTMAIPFVEKKIARIINMVVWDRLCAWLSGDPTFRRKLERRKQALKDQIGVSRDDSDNRNKARRTLPQAGVAPHRQLVPPTAASRPRRLLHTGGGSKATLRNSPHTQVQYPTGLISFLKGVALVIFSILL